MDNEVVLALLSMLVVGFACFGMGIIVGANNHEYIIDSLYRNDYNSEGSNNTVCLNLSLEETSDCLVKHVKTFYNYTIRDELNYTGSQGSYLDVVENGGDCYDYARIYIGMFEDRGFNARMIKFVGNDTERGHAVVMAWGNETIPYCLIDQRYGECYG